MLYPLSGKRISAPPWVCLAVDEVLMYYDGPRLLLQRCDAGQWYLAWWSDSDAELDRWIYLPLSLERMAAILSGQLECLDALRRPEGGHLLVVDIHVATDAIAQAVITDANAIPADARPLPGSRLKIGLPSVVQAEWAGAVSAPRKVAFDETAPSILEMFDRIHRNAPEGAFDELPTDLSANLKHYLYGFPKDDE